MYTSTSAIIQACNNSIFAYQIYFNLQNRYLNFFIYFIQTFSTFFHPNIRVHSVQVLHKILDKVRKTNFIIDQFKERFELDDISTILMGGGKKSCHNADNVYCNWYPEINDKSGFCQCCRFYAYCMRFDLSSFFFSPFLFFSFSSFRHSFSHTDYIYIYIALELLWSNPFRERNV